MTESVGSGIGIGAIGYMTIGADSGPPYPIPPRAGSNAWGIGAVGVAQVGDIPPLYWWDTVISQYANSPIITKWISNLAAYFDQTENLDGFFDLVFNVDTAEGYGLDVWGRRVGIGRVLSIPSMPFFGFKESGTAKGFGQAPFFNGSPVITNYALSDSDYRRLIIAKAAANITNDSIPSINAILAGLFFGRGNVYVRDAAAGTYFGFKQSGTARGFGQAPFMTSASSQLMNIQYVFPFVPTPIDLAVINSGVVPRPSGVSASVITLF